MKAWWWRAQHLAGIGRPIGYCAYCSKTSAPYPTVHNVEAFVDGRCHNERDSNSIFLTHRCPRCDGKEFRTYEDGGSHGYEVRFFCIGCKTEWGLHLTHKICEEVQQGHIPGWAL